MPQYGLLELLQGRARLDAELVHEQAARLPVDLECVRLPARAVQSPHQLRAEALAQRMTTREPFELRNDFRVTAERQVRLDAPLEGAQPQLLEPLDLGLREGLVGEVCERRASPESQRLAEQ